MSGNAHVRFSGGKAAAMPPTYPINHRGHLPQTLADRVALQADQAELPAEVLLWGKRQCHQNSNLGHAYCQPAALIAAKLAGKALELLWTGNDGAYSTDGIPQHEHFLQHA